jgi:hypothetical protein
MVGWRSVPLQNRVTPYGAIVADPARGAWTGNRGILHDETRVIRRPWQVRRWITCRLEFRGHHREVMTPNRWTELFFLDEATAFAAGHRPCAECRRGDYVRFRDLWAADHPADPAGADAMDRRLHAERVTGRREKRVVAAEVAGLPDGAFVTIDGAAWLVWGDALLEWSFAGYRARRRRPARSVAGLLTPPGLVAVLRAGYRPQVDASAT